MRPWRRQGRAAPDPRRRAFPDGAGFTRQAIHEDVAAGIRPLRSSPQRHNLDHQHRSSARSPRCVNNTASGSMSTPAYGGRRGRSELRWVLDGAERADSIVVNPHKWLLAPIDCTRFCGRDDPKYFAALLDRARVPHRHRRIDEDAPESHGLWNVPRSTHARAFKLWMVIRISDSRARSAHSRALRISSTLARWVAAERDFELLAPTPLSVVCLRAHPPGLDDPGTLDSLNQRIVERINTAGRFFVFYQNCGGLRDSRCLRQPATGAASRRRRDHGIARSSTMSGCAQCSAPSGRKLPSTIRGWPGAELFEATAQRIGNGQARALKPKTNLLTPGRLRGKWTRGPCDSPAQRRPIPVCASACSAWMSGIHRSRG